MIFIILIGYIIFFLYETYIYFYAAIVRAVFSHSPTPFRGEIISTILLIYAEEAFARGREMILATLYASFR